ncbi:MAG: twin-arginine translocation pathway signal protein [Proteobacteria bacterium]|nr:twin-arginine translocation pathway signal protein [Pseudomonadota bacterium]
MLAYSILAPNPHNMQPWQITLGEGRDFTVYCDLDRLLPETDPPNRQITIGFGCFLELCQQAAAETGFRADITYFPEGEPQPLLDGRPVAHVELVEDSSVLPDPLFSTVLDRRTNRLPYDISRSVDPGMLPELQGGAVDGVEVLATADAAFVEELRTFTTDAWRVEWDTASTRRESIEVMHIGKAAVDARPYGLSMDDRLTSTIGMLGLMSPEALDDPESSAYKESYKFYERACASAMAFVWSTTPSNTRRAQLEAGRAWVRTQLIANALGLSFHPLSQALQEFPEMAEYYKRAHGLLSTNAGDTVQMLARLGYAPDVGPAPRQNLESKLLPI